MCGKQATDVPGVCSFSRSLCKHDRQRMFDRLSVCLSDAHYVPAPLSWFNVAVAVLLALSLCDHRIMN